MAPKSSPKRKLGREISVEEKAAAVSKSSPKGKLGRETAWKRRWERQPRVAQKGNYKGK